MVQGLDRVEKDNLTWGDLTVADLLAKDAMKLVISVWDHYKIRAHTKIGTAEVVGEVRSIRAGGAVVEEEVTFDGVVIHNDKQEITGKVTITLAVRVASSTTTTAASSSSLAGITAASTSAVDAGNTSNSSSAVRPLASTDGTPSVPPIIIKAAAAPTVADSQSIQGLGLGTPLETVKPMNNNNNSSSSATTDDDGKAADEYFDNYEEEEGDFDQVTHRPTPFSSTAYTHVSHGVTDDSPTPPYFVVHPNHPSQSLFPSFSPGQSFFVFTTSVHVVGQFRH